ncbi:DUF4376 domain-containing protein [Stutzerimonas kunmingensis]|uniref:DUF4376 domain-containing protein n=1 Tax=Stutzerimonas kunmingensis TaxID=1211807 RepID=UPI00241DA285|nr:DUF4376 domain-containing protein [Stutzerimonas kunmingensis]
MRYLKYTYVDAVTGVPVTQEPARNGPVPPDVDGLGFGFALESQYPTLIPTLYGTCPDESVIDLPGVLAELSETEYQSALEAEMAARRQRLIQQIADRRWQAEVAGIDVGGMHIDTGRDSQALITGATVQAMLDPNYSLRWKTVAGFVDLTAEQIIAVATAARGHVQACFNREAELLDALSAGTFSPEMLEQGWPA